MKESVETCGCYLTHKDCRARKAKYGSRCDHKSTRFFRTPETSIKTVKGNIWGRCADHVSRDTLRMLKSGDIEEISFEEASKVSG